MGRTYQRADKYLESGIEPGSVFVEIGSERGEGSTLYLARLAEQHGTVLHTVDVSDHAAKTLKHPALICHVEPGMDWIRNTYPSINKYISLLYLDNFDWIWDVDAIPQWIVDQIIMYREQFKTDMNNDNCQQEHFNQMIGLMPYMAPKCLVLLDDTYHINGAWSGKGGPTVVALRHLGFTILEQNEALKEVIMGRGY